MPAEEIAVRIALLFLSRRKIAIKTGAKEHPPAIPE